MRRFHRRCGAHRDTLLRLGLAYKQINATVGELGLNSLTSTAALASNSLNDATYTSLEDKLAVITGERNQLAARMRAVLEGAALSRQVLDPGQAKDLNRSVSEAAESNGR